MTIVSTILAFGFTLLSIFVYGTTALGIESTMDFESLGIGFALLVIPLLIGAGLRFCIKTKDTIKIIEKCIAVLTAIFIIIAIVLVCIEYEDALTGELSDYRIWIPALLHSPIAAGISYAISKYVFGFSPAVSRTIFFEVTLQNSVIAYSVIELSMKKKSDRADASLYPLAFTIYMFFWACLAIPFMRRQQEQNEADGIEDREPEFDPALFGLDAEEDEEEGEENENKKKKKELEQEGGGGTEMTTENTKKEEIAVEDGEQKNVDQEQGGEEKVVVIGGGNEPAFSPQTPQPLLSSSSSSSS